MTILIIMRIATSLLIIQLGMWFLAVQVRGQVSSVLAEGDWYKFAITHDGIYRLTGAELASLGVNLSSVNAETIRMYGHGGGMLPQALSAPRLIDLPEIAIQVVDGGDGKLDDQDYVLFYGQSPHELRYEKDSSDTYHPVYHTNLYSDTTYYFLTFGGASGKRVQKVSPINNPSWSTNYYQEVLVHEDEDINILDNYSSGNNGSGREWYGDELVSGDEFQLGESGWRTEKKVQVHTRILGRSLNAAEVQLTLNGAALGKITLEPILTGTYTQKGKLSQEAFFTEADRLNGAANTTLAITLSGSGAKAHLDQVVVEGAKTLQVNDQSLRFRNLESTTHPSTRFTIAATQKPLVWNITNPQEPHLMEVSSLGERWVFSSNTGGELSEFVAATKTVWETPEFVGPVTNQDLKGGSVPNLLIITREDILPEATRLAEFRQSHNQLKVRIVTSQQIYNEFSSGAQDVTALRNYIKYLYDRQPEQLQSVLLLGKGSYDYKNYTENNTNVVPIYQSRNSVHPIYSYSSDDYFGFLEDSEGEWEESFAGDHTMDIGVGRIPVKNREEARIVVDKLIYYETSEKTFGQWRNQVVFVADDGDNDKHQQDAEQLAKIVDTTYVPFSIQKIYTDAFAQQKLPGREVAPAVNQQIEDAIKKGALLINYTGHGSETQWAHEDILTTSMINGFRNKDQLPFFVTATCEFGRHDDPQQISGAEQLILNPNGGAIGLVTTARPVFSNSNFLLNRAFYNEVFRRENGKPLSLGEIFRRTKNNGLNGPVNRNFSLLGDPSMVLAYPQDQIVLDQLAVRQPNGEYRVTDTLRALDHVRVMGSVVSPANQQIVTDFSGKVAVEVLDKATFRRTQGNEGTFMQFEERNSVIHRGNARVSQGQFTIEFVIPKNIVYQTGLGKITAYAEASSRDAHGAFMTFAIGGSLPISSADDLPPQIQLYMDDTTFTNGGLTSENTLLLAKMQDEHGISISPSGLGQAISAELTHGETGENRTFVLNDFYQTELDDFQSGWIRYPLENLEEGSYRLTLRAWDTYNNEGTAQLEFRVGEEEKLWVSEFYNYPNPFSEETQFVLDHNHPGNELDITIQIYNSQGEAIHTLHTVQKEVATRLNDLQWDGRTIAGARLPSGIYYATIRVQVTGMDLIQEKTHQIIIAH